MGQGDELGLELSLIPGLGEVVIVLPSPCMRACSRLSLFIGDMNEIVQGENVYDRERRKTSPTPVFGRRVI